MNQRVRVDIIRCDGHGYCAEILPERIRLDDWGFPMVDETPLTRDLLALARRAVNACPLLALRIDSTEAR